MITVNEKPLSLERFRELLKKSVQISVVGCQGIYCDVCENRCSIYDHLDMFEDTCDNPDMIVDDENSCCCNVCDQEDDIPDNPILLVSEKILKQIDGYDELVERMKAG